MNTLPKIQEIYLQGRNSQKEIVIEVETVNELVDAYLTKIPNDQRTTKMSLKVLRLHDNIAGILISEAKAVAEEAHKRTMKIYTEDSEVTDDLPIR